MANVEGLVKGIGRCQSLVHTHAGRAHSTLLQSVTGASIKFSYPWWVSFLGPWPDLSTPLTSFDALLYRSDYDLGIVHRLELTLTARGLRL